MKCLGLVVSLSICMLAAFLVSVLAYWEPMGAGAFFVYEGSDEFCVVFNNTNDMGWCVKYEDYGYNATRWVDVYNLSYGRVIYFNQVGGLAAYIWFNVPVNATNVTVDICPGHYSNNFFWGIGGPPVTFELPEFGFLPMSKRFARRKH